MCTQAGTGFDGTVIVPVTVTCQLNAQSRPDSGNRVFLARAICAPPHSKSLKIAEHSADTCARNVGGASMSDVPWLNKLAHGTGSRLMHIPSGSNRRNGDFSCAKQCIRVSVLVVQAMAQAADRSVALRAGRLLHCPAARIDEVGVAIRALEPM